MAAKINENTQYTDPDTGELLNNGFVYIGSNGLDAKLNPITIYADRELTTAILNPQRTGSDGRVVNKIWIDGKYSMKVEDSDGVQKLNDLSLGELTQTNNTTLINVQGTDSLTAEGSPAVTGLVNNQVYILTAANNNAGAMTLTIDLNPTWPIKKHHDRDMEPDDIEAGQTLAVIWNETDSIYELMTNSAIAPISSQWDRFVVAVFVSTTSFTVTGDLTADYEQDRRIKCNDSSALYGVITSSIYSAPNTTVVVSLDSGSLSASLSGVKLSILTVSNDALPDTVAKRNEANTFAGKNTHAELVTLSAGANVASAATIDLTTATGNSPRITGITATSAITMNAGQQSLVVADGAWPLTYNATTNKLNGGASYTCAAGDMVLYNKDLSGIVHGHIIKADGTAVVEAAPTAAQGSSMALISSATASADATIEFTGLDSTYEEYIFILNQVVPATDAVTLAIRYGDSGSYRSDAAYDYHITDLTSSSAAYSAVASEVATELKITSNLGNAADESYSGWIRISITGSSTRRTLTTCSGTTINSANATIENFGGGSYDGTLFAVDRIQFLMSSGNIASGEFRLYGIKKA